LLDTSDFVWRELGASVEGIGVLYFGAICGFVPDVWTVFGGAGMQTLELVERCLDIAWHGDVDVAIFVVSIDGYSAI
jgi:hypothetical protein